MNKIKLLVKYNPQKNLNSRLSQRVDPPKRLKINQRETISWPHRVTTLWNTVHNASQPQKNKLKR